MQEEQKGKKKVYKENCEEEMSKRRDLCGGSGSLFVTPMPICLEV